MDGESEVRPGKEEAVAAAHRSVERARDGLEREQREAARRELGGWLIKARENKWLREPMKRLAALFLGVPLSAGAAENIAPVATEDPAPAVAMLDVDSSNPAPETPAAEPEIPDESVLWLRAFSSQLQADHEAGVSAIERSAMWDARYPEMDGFYLWQLAQVGKTIESGQAAPEYYARVGRPEWTPYQRALFAEAPVQERFVELHPEFRNLSGEEFVDAYPEMLALAQTEFRFSSQFRFLTEDAIDLFAATVPNMEPGAALARYDSLLTTIGANVGLASVIRLSDAVASRVPADHPVAKRIAELRVDSFRPFVGRSKGNVLHMDQARGQLRVLRVIEGDYVLIDAFPAIGGPLNSPEMSVAGKPSGSEFVHVPDTAMRVSYVDRAKTSWSWQNSWVPQGAPIREADGELQYQSPGNKRWYDLTGPNAEFFPDRDGAGIKPFDARVEPMDKGLIRAATHQGGDGTTFTPSAWSVESLAARNGGEIPTTWDWNDFGSVAIRLNDANGERTNINIHSKPGEDINGFLGNRTHGCLSTYGKYVKSVVDTYGIGSGSTVLVTTEYDYDLTELRK